MISDQIQSLFFRAFFFYNGRNPDFSSCFLSVTQTDVDMLKGEQMDCVHVVPEPFLPKYLKNIP
jgi:hypothetical protein